MQDEIASGVGSIIKFFVFQVLWALILFNLGRVTLLLITLGRYPRGRWLELHMTRISFAGVAVLALAWLGVVGFNRTIGA